MEPKNQTIQHPSNDSRSTEELVRLAVTEKDDDAVDKLICVLHWRGSREVLDAAWILCSSLNFEERRIGALILGQLGVPERSFPEECFQILANMIPRERDPDVLGAIAVAFGHLNDSRAVELVLPLKDHADSDVRWHAVRAFSGHEHPLAIAALIQLSGDDDSDVRDWAAFGLGTLLDVDTPEIREALLARTTDVDDDTRGEALVGLAKRKDERVFDPLVAELTSGNVGLLALEASEELGDARLLPALLELKESWREDQDRHTGRLDHALSSCLANLEGHTQ